MKKILTIILALILILSLVACGKDTKQTSTGNPDSKPSQSQNTNGGSSDTDPEVSDPEAGDPEVDQPNGNDSNLNSDPVVEPGKNDHIHSYTSVVTKEATCTADGIKTISCSGCTYKKTEAITKQGHKYKDVVTAPTCTANGYTTHTCERCSASLKDTYTDAKGHKFTSSRGSTTTTIKCSACTLKFSQANNMVDYYAVSDTAYWKDGELHIQYILVNTSNSAFKVSSIENYYFDNSKGQKITTTLTWKSPNITVSANGTHTVTLTVKKEHVLNYGIDISNVGMAATLYGNWL